MESMLISKLTPAETLLVRDESQASVRDLLKYTLMDLLLKQVLQIDDVERQPNSRDPVRVYRYVSKGKNFKNYFGLSHELPFLSPFYGNPDIRILFKNCVRIGYENAGGKRALHERIRTSPAIANMFCASLIQKIFGRYDYTPEGLQFKGGVEEELQQLENELPTLLVTDRQRALEKLKLIGGNVFLLKGLDFAMLKEIEQAFPRTLVEEHTGGCGSGCSTWSSFDSDDGGDSDSGCSSGDSGCSGCGGCGGD